MAPQAAKKDSSPKKDDSAKSFENAKVRINMEALTNSHEKEMDKLRNEHANKYIEFNGLRIELENISYTMTYSNTLI